MNPGEAGRRITAARALAGLKSTEALAAKIGQRRMGATTLRKIERGEEPALPPVLQAVARACELPYGFFTADLSVLDGELDEVTAQRLSTVEAELAGAHAVEQRLAALEDIIRRDLAPLAGLDPVRLNELVEAAAQEQPGGTRRTRTPRRRGR